MLQEGSLFKELERICNKHGCHAHTGADTRRGGPNENMGAMQTQGLAQGKQQAMLSEAAVQHLLGNSVSSGMAWAGAAHWRYRTRSSAKPAAAEGAAAAEDAAAAKPAARYHNHAASGAAELNWNPESKAQIMGCSALYWHVRAFEGNISCTAAMHSGRHVCHGESH